MITCDSVWMATLMMSTFAGGGRTRLPRDPRPSAGARLPPACEVFGCPFIEGRPTKCEKYAFADHLDRREPLQVCRRQADSNFWTGPDGSGAPSSRVNPCRARTSRSRVTLRTSVISDSNPSGTSRRRQTKSESRPSSSPPFDERLVLVGAKLGLSDFFVVVLFAAAPFDLLLDLLRAVPALGHRRQCRQAPEESRLPDPYHLPVLVDELRQRLGVGRDRYRRPDCRKPDVRRAALNHPRIEIAIFVRV